MGKRTPVKALIEFKTPMVWSRVDPKTSKPPLFIRNPNLNEGDKPRLLAEIVKSSVFDLTDVFVTAVIYDEDNNAIAVSQTFLNGIRNGATSNIFFTWPAPLATIHPTMEIYPRVDLVSRIQ